ncbi:MAG: hypothetical protein OXC41_06605 [Gammaproteobacteria bacterium]|nr:hypothetical protein [Gammaproteobacteria bacterium]
MPVINRQVLEEFIRTGENALNTTEQGRALEEFICSLFALVPGITITHRNALNVFDTEEIDVALWNDCDDAGLSFLPNIILVECKNWSVRIGSEEVNWFDTKLRHRGLDFGILISPKGITGNQDNLSAAHSIISKALAERRRLVVLTTREILELGDTDDLSHLIKKKLCNLAVNGALV